MAHIKISQLPYNGAPDGNGVIPIVLSGATWSTNLQDIVDNFLVSELSGAFQLLSEKTQDISVDGTSTTKYPSAKAVKTYVDGITVGLLSDRGNYTPGLVSPGAFPSTGGRGPGGIPAKGDLWFIAANGYVGTTAVTTGQSVRALIDAPGQTAANWDILDVAGWTVAPEDTANKVTSKATFISNGSSTVKYPSIKAVKDYIDQNVTLQSVLNADHSLTSNNNLQGTLAGSSMGVGVGSINAFGFQSAAYNTGNVVNAFGPDSASSNSGSKVNAFGANAANNNSGTNVEAIGEGAAQDNQASNVVAIGLGAGANNSGTSLVAIGVTAGYNNTALDCVFIGNISGYGNQADSVTGLGAGSCNNNSGDSVSGIGPDAARNNLGNFVQAVGAEAAKGNTADYVNAIGNRAGYNNTYSHVTLLGKNSAASANNQVVFANSGGFNSRIGLSAVTADRNVNFPNASGTMVLSVNGTAPDAAGDVTLTVAGGLPYLMYAAYINLTSAPSVIVTQLYNTIGDGSGDGINDIAITYSLGNVTANMSSAPFTTKTVFVPGGYVGNGTFYGLTGSRNSSSQVAIFSNLANGTFGNQQSWSFVSNIYIEIRIYP